ncbi:hypothetical protein HII28_10695 [Planctomonas sp. JC2975]|uniref:fascin domain-containing protein n=1 Tax=Planctomonas sp. JC2975 TaxID=2729626 RepID=UPI0014743465|nr:hypothetical protein [Planctomonas sp. JC2975]NNC12342.1 hypothetical protein [Planctomonas sp. JC2975]
MSDAHVTDGLRSATGIRPPGGGVRPEPGTPPVNAPPDPFAQTDGEFALQTGLKDLFVTAVGGGGRITDTIHTTAVDPGYLETFRLWTEEGSPYYAIQTIDGHWVTAVGAGGRITDTIHTDATNVASWELFTPVRVAETDHGVSGFAFQTTKGYFLTAVGGGGHDTGDTIHTDATVAQSWETFRPYRRGAFGTGTTYGIQVWGGNRSEQADLRGWLVAVDGGGYPTAGGLWLAEEGQLDELSWTLLKQPDGRYALQTSHGTVLTAIDGGAPGSGFSTNTPVDAIGENEKFTLVDNGDFTAWIQTPIGTYISNDTSIVADVSNISRALRFRLQIFDWAPGPTG